MMYQGYVEAGVWGYPLTYFGVFHADTLGLLPLELTFDQGVYDEIRDGVEDWWKKHIWNRDPVESRKPLESLPEVKGEVSFREDPAFALAVAEALDARDIRQEAQDLESEAKRALKELIGELGVFEGGGGRVYFQEFSGNISWKSSFQAIAAECPIDPMKLQLRLVEQLVSFGVEEKTVLNVLCAIAGDVRMELPTKKQKGYQRLSIYKLTNEED